MDINKFRLVHIPAKSHYLQKFGFTSAPSSQFTGDEPAPMPMDKISSIAAAEREDMYRLQQELEGSKDEA